MTKLQTATITVDGAYTPNTVTFKQGEPAQLTFNRISTTGCLDEVILPKDTTKYPLPLNTPQTFDIDTSKAGEYEFTCGMNMALGKVVVQ
ncbi:cupredoxin domain-containing protein [Lactiplantibacillus fabifermentans]|uniref:EfeO-type cupredoxin-like domain-containing protein n=2 Tax=Lactiplantibacillus fabifermentans TaxID=483011 RepID=A0A0R2NMF0_9LACO|nr:cupredoxin domain-containing protein [Lactiplantibacillus fabifermentans]ETY73270.1 copper-binding protein [Lactiplantibacillus fabifermentans T30PCM01]KRO26862.1 hypothetical protein DY78_GL000547 [Lactiplantibacillus fabifermentans DSM 21115]